MLQFRLVFICDQSYSQNWEFSANFKPYMKNIGPGIAPEFTFENVSLVDT